MTDIKDLCNRCRKSPKTIDSGFCESCNKDFWTKLGAYLEAQSQASGSDSIELSTAQIADIVKDKSDSNN